MARAKIPPMSEKAWQACVIRLATMLGYMCYHTHDSRRSQKGFPDLVLLKGRALLFVELKSEAGKVSPEQQAWLDELRSGGHAAFVWRPSQIDDVAAILRGTA